MFYIVRESVLFLSGPLQHAGCGPVQGLIQRGPDSDSMDLTTPGFRFNGFKDPRIQIHGPGFTGPWIQICDIWSADGNRASNKIGEDS